MNRRVLACVALAAALVPAAAPARADGEQAPVSTSAWDGRCADATFVGARGSGEAPPFGATVDAALTGMRDSLPEGASLLRTYVDFPAASPYALAELPPEQLLLADRLPANDYSASARTGRAELRRFLTDLRTRCPRTAIALAGFSQGAEVVSEALADGVGLEQVATVVVVGDPTNAAGRAARQNTDAPQGAVGLMTALEYLRLAARDGRSAGDAEGLRAALRAALALDRHVPDPARLGRTLAGARLALPPDGYARVHSVCRSGDVVCDAGTPLAKILLHASTMRAEVDRARPVHGGYNRAVLQETIAVAGPQWASQVRVRQEEPQPDRPDWRPWAYAGAGVAALLVSFMGGLLTGRLTARRRRDASPRAVPARPDGVSAAAPGPAPAPAPAGRRRGRGR